MSGLVHVHDDGGVRSIRLDRPDKKNALTGAMYDAMTRAITDASARTEIRCLTIAGGPGAFCAGNDIGDFLRAGAEGGDVLEPVIPFLHALARNAKPLVAAVEGAAVGVGATMLLHCDQVVAASDLRLSAPFVGLGLLPEAASSLLAPRLLGHPRAFSLLVMGQPLDAEQAKAWGLVTHVVAPGQTDAQALRIARAICALPPDAVALARRLMRGPAEDIVTRIDEEARLFAQRLATIEARDALQGFMTRKKKDDPDRHA